MPSFFLSIPCDLISTYDHILASLRRKFPFSNFGLYMIWFAFYDYTFYTIGLEAISNESGLSRIDRNIQLSINIMIFREDKKQS
jgi:hypothetical protein